MSPSTKVERRGHGDIDSVPFVGRAQELATAVEAIGRAMSGRRAVLLVEGEPGIGKTRLVDEALEVSGARAQLLRGEAHELERTRPFGAVVDALGISDSSDPARAELGRLLRQVADHAAAPLTVGLRGGLHHRVAEAVVDLVGGLAAEQPVVLVLEDLQWADPSTLLVLHALLCRRARVPLALVGTFRPEPSSEGLAALVEALDRQGATRLTLGPLDDGDVACLAEQLTGGVPGRRLALQLARANGNPLYVVELVRALVAEGTVTTEAGTSEVVGDGLPPALRLILLRRLRTLGRVTIDVLRTAAVMGSSVDPRDLALVTRRSALDLLGTLDEAVSAGVLEDRDGRLVFRHDLLREALYADIPPAVRAALHAEMGRALATAEAPALQVAHHLALGARPGDLDAVHWLRAAAGRSVARAPDVAVDLLGRALALLDGDDPQRDALAAEQVAALSGAGRVPEALALARRTLARPHDPAVDEVLRHDVVSGLVDLGRTSEAAAEASAALRAGASPRLWAAAALATLWEGDAGAAVAAAEAVVAEATAAGDHVAAGLGQVTLALAAHLGARGDDALRHAARAVAVAQTSREPPARRASAHLVQALALADADRLGEARAALAAGGRRAEDRGATPVPPADHAGAALVAFLGGDWDEAVAEAEACLARAAETGLRHGAVAAQAVAAAVAAHRGDLAGAERALAGARAELARGRQYRWAWVGWTAALVEEARGQPAAALASLQGTWEACVAAGTTAELPVLGPDLVRLLVGQGQRGRARDVARVVGEAAGGIAAPWATGAALRCRGMADDDPDVVVAAVHALGASPRLLERALACVDAGGSLGRAGRAGQAAALLDEALAAFAGLGARRHLGRTLAALRALGVRRSVARPARRGAVGWESLTEAEAAVVALVAEGLTNREAGERLYVSARTVETHLTHVFAKLGLASRSALRAEVRRRGLAPPSPAPALAR